MQSRGIYLQIEDSPWIVGDTLWVSKTDQQTASGKVVGVTTTSMLLAWIAAPLNVSVNDQVVVKGPHRAFESAENPPLTGQTDRKSILGEAGVRSVSRTRQPLALHGYYSASVIASVSDIKGQFSSNRSNSRSHASPNSSIRATLSGLPIGMKAIVSLRGSQRFSSEKIIGQAGSFRAYEMSVSRHTSGARLEFDLGRFHSSQLASSGYWDGISTSIRTGAFKFGVAAGYEPDRYNESFQTDIYKVAAFSEISARHTGGETNLTLSATQINGTSITSPLLFLTLEQRSRFGKTRVNSEIQVDQSPLDNSWTLSRLYVRANTSLTPTLSMNARFGTRKYYYYWLADGRYSSAKRQATLGFLLRKNIGLFGLNLGTNSFSGGETSQSIGVSVRIKPTWLPFTFSNASNVWSRTNGNTYYNTSSFQKEIGRFTLGLDYSLLAVDALGPISLSHIGGVSVRVSTDKWGYFSIRQRTHIGSAITSASLYFNYGISF